MKMGSETYHHLKALIKEQYGLDATAVGDEGGFAPNFQNNEDAIKLCVGAIEKAGYTGKIKLGMEVRSESSLVSDGCGVESVLFLDEGLQVVVGLTAHLHGLGEGRGAGGQNHELLHGQFVSCM